MRDRLLAILLRFRLVGVPIVEGWLRFVEVGKLTLLALLRRRTVLEVVNPGVVRGGRVTIFTTHPHGGLSYLHERLLTKFAARGHAIIVVSHHPRARTLLGPICGDRWCLMLRRPFGRDFGGYRDALAFARGAAQAEGIPLERVVFVNDSVYTFGDGEDRIVEHLDRDDLPFAAITENHQFRYHAASYMLGVSGEALESAPVAAFWRRYRPISTRRWSIHRGEMGFSQALIRAGYFPRTLYEVAGMRQHLARNDMASIAAIVLHMNARANRLRAPLTILDDAIARLIGPPPRSTAAPSGDDPTEPLVRQRDRHYGLDGGRQAAMLRHEVDHAVATELLTHVFGGSQIHRAAPLLLAMGAGIVKRDLLWREVIQPHDVHDFLLLGRGDAADRAEIAFRLRDKGHPLSLTIRERILRDWGFT